MRLPRLSLRVALLTAVLVFVAGCSRGEKKIEKCHKPQEYQQSRPGPRVRVPEGKEELNPDERLRLPYGKTRDEPIRVGDPCLAEPPQF